MLQNLLPHEAAAVATPLTRAKRTGREPAVSASMPGALHAGPPLSAAVNGSPASHSTVAPGVEP